MAEIPKYNQRANIPGSSGGVNVSPEKMAQPFLAEAQQGEVIGKIGNQGAALFAHIDNAMENARAVVEAANVKTQLIKDSQLLKEQLSTTIDPETGKQTTRINGWENFVPETETFHSDKLEKYRGMVTNERTWQMLQPIIAQHHSKEIIDAKKHAIEVENARWKEDWLVNREFVKDAYVKTGDPSIVKDFEKDTMALIRSGAIGAADGISHLTALAKGGDLLRIENAIDQNAMSWISRYGNIEKALPELQKQYPYLDETSLRQANKYAFGAANREKALMTEANKLQAEAAEKNLTDLDVAGKLKPSDVGKYRNILSADQYKEWNRRIEANEKKRDSSEFKTDKGLEAKLYRTIIEDKSELADRKTYKDTEIADLVGNGLSRTSADFLINKNREPKVAKSPQVEAVYDNFKRDRKAGIFGTEQTGDIEYTKQVGAFESWVKKNPDKDPAEYYEKIMAPVRMKVVFDFLQYNGSSNPKAKREAMESSGEIPQRRATDKKPIAPAANFDEANLNNQAKWLNKREPAIKEALAGKPAGTYPISTKAGAKVWVQWDPEEGRLTIKSGGIK